MTSPLRSSVCLFALLCLGAFGLALATHGFQAHAEPDSDGYLEFDWSSVPGILSNIRTCGYPLFLRGVRLVSDDLNAVAIAQWLAWFAAAIVLYRGLVRSGYRSRAAAWAAGCLLYGHAALTFTPTILADSLATALSVAATGCFLATSIARPGKSAWAGLAIATFLAWMVRPACLFLIPLWPLLSIFFSCTLFRQDRSLAVRKGLICLLATVVPFVAYCSLRWAVVGHWGLVSFGGYNIVGVAGQFLSEEDIPDLPTDLQPLGREILKRRAAIRTILPPTDFPAMEQSFNPTVWQLIVPAVRNGIGDDPMQVNTTLSQLSSELLQLHRKDYARWLFWNAKHAVRQSVLITLTDRSTLLMGALLILVHLASLLRGGCATPPQPVTDELPRARHVEGHLLLWTALAFAAAKTLLVILVEPAIGRYMIAATVLFPPVLAVLVARYAEDVFPNRDNIRNFAPERSRNA